jgi:hypothetical protein
VGSDVEVGCYEADEFEGGYTGLALVLGNPEATALVILGKRPDILALLNRAERAVEGYPTRRIAITDIDGSVSVRNAVSGDMWTPETAAEQLHCAIEDGTVLRIEVREG